MANELHTSPKTGSEYEDIARVVNQYIFGNSAPSTLEDGYPSILAVDLHALYPNLGSANHVVLCVGYRTLPNENEIEYMYLLDPYYGVQDPT